MCRDVLLLGLRDLCVGRKDPMCEASATASPLIALAHRSPDQCASTIAQIGGAVEGCMPDESNKWVSARYSCTSVTIFDCDDAQIACFASSRVVTNNDLVIRITLGYIQKELQNLTKLVEKADQQAAKAQGGCCWALIQVASVFL